MRTSGLSFSARNPIKTLFPMLFFLISPPSVASARTMADRVTYRLSPAPRPRGGWNGWHRLVLKTWRCRFTGEETGGFGKSRSMSPDIMGGGNVSMGTTRWRTRSQRIRTEGEVPFEVVLVDAEKRSVYQRVAEEAEHLRRLGLSNSKIAQHFRVDDKTVAKAIRWRYIFLVPKDGGSSP